MRADAQRNREMILEAAGTLFAERGAVVQMDDIAARSGLGMGTLYRHFPTKQMLLAAIVGHRFDGMTELARTAAGIDDPDAAFTRLLQTYLEAAALDAAFRVALLGPEQPDWTAVDASKNEFMKVARPIIRRAVTNGSLRPDFTMKDFILVTRGIMANMAGDMQWRRHLKLTLSGVLNMGTART